MTSVNCGLRCMCTRWVVDDTAHSAQRHCFDGDQILGVVLSGISAI